MTSQSRFTLSIAKEFSRTPGPRRRTEGQFSGEDFLTMLRTHYEQAVKEQSTLLVDLDGAAGYATSFLEAAFGGLARECGAEAVLHVLRFKSEDEPDLVEEITQYIREARPA